MGVGRIAAALAMCIGCSGTDEIVPSEALGTDKLTINATGTIGPLGVLVVSTVLRNGDGASVELSGADQLFSTKAAETNLIQLNLDAGSPDPVYSVAYDPAIVEESMSVWMLRATHSSASNTTFTVPPPFDIIAVGLLSSDEPTEVTWDNADDESSILVTLQGDCIGLKEFELPQDVGGITLPALVDAEGQCPVTITVSRRRMGMVDSAYANGTALGRQVRRVVAQLQ